MQEISAVVLTILLLLLAQGPARAEQGSADRIDGGLVDGPPQLAPIATPPPVAPPPPPTAARTPPPGRTLEFNIVPIAGGDSDVGIGGGEVADLARLDPRYHPFR